jgi:hypothetical protein
MAKRVDWTNEQNRIIVEAYFQMLRMQQRGEPYVKAQYKRWVEEQTRRTSVDRKFQNISFLLQEMGHPIVTGYKPAPNTQRGPLYQAISHQLETGLLQTSQYPPLFTAMEREVEASGAFQPDSLEDARERTYQNIVLRRGQAAFRRELLEAYQGKCAFTGYDSEFALEACHIIPYRGSSTNHVSNGLLLRADIHTLFDLGKTAVDTANMTVILAAGMVHSSYADLLNTTIALPQDSLKRPSPAAFDQHRFLVGL